VNDRLRGFIRAGAIASVLLATVAASRAADPPSVPELGPIVGQAVRWLVDNQNAGGSFGSWASNACMRRGSTYPTG